MAVAPVTQLLVERILRIGTIFYGGNFAVRRGALEAIGGFDTSIDFHGEHLYSWKTLLRCGKTWPAVKAALRRSVDVALMLYRNGEWAG